MVEKISEFVYNGELDAEFIAVESEHSALSAAVGASLAGARVFTATASQGLALMYEILYIASAMRTPIVMALGNRAFSAPINIHCSHDDAYAVRDTGWLQFFAENVQEAYDLVLMAFKISESPEVLTPSIVNLDGFILTHCIEPLYIWNERYIQEFLPDRKPVEAIDYRNPKTYGPLALMDYYMLIKRQQYEVVRRARATIDRVFDEYSRWSGRRYRAIKTYMMDDAEYAFVVLGSTAGTMRSMVDKWRGMGRKVGLVSLTLYRPFPEDDLRRILSGVEAIGVMDRSHTYGGPGAQLYQEIASTLYSLDEHPRLLNIIYGLGGKDFGPEDAEAAYKYLMRPDVREVWLGVEG
jgi:pyruvate ferredoxin oxidoreductase alpha subunit